MSTSITNWWQWVSQRLVAQLVWCLFRNRIKIWLRADVKKAIIHWIIFINWYLTMSRSLSAPVFVLNGYFDSPFFFVFRFILPQTKHAHFFPPLPSQCHSCTFWIRSNWVSKYLKINKREVKKMNRITQQFNFKSNQIINFPKNFVRDGFCWRHHELYCL